MVVNIYLKIDKNSINKLCDYNICGFYVLIEAHGLFKYKRNGFFLSRKRKEEFFSCTSD